MDSTDRRTHFRLSKETRVTCQEISYPLGLSDETSVQMLDVSEGGVRLDSRKSFAKGTLLQVALVLEGWQKHTSGFLRHQEVDLSKPLTAIGRVVRCEALSDGNYDLGVQFLDIWDDHWRAMRICLERERAETSLEAPQPERG